MIDIHAHVLPGVDDGPRTLGEAVAMCRASAEEGVAVIVATPHQRHERWANDDRLRLSRLAKDVREALGPTGPRIELGAEIAVDSELLTELDAYREGSLCSLAGTRYLLLELSVLGLGPDPLWLVHELTMGGWHPIFAHPERFRWLAEDLGLMQRMVERGALFQITAMSVLGEFGARALSRSRAMLDAGLVHFVASDTHDLRRRPPGLRRVYAGLCSRWGEPTARRLTIDHPRVVLEGRYPLVSSGPEAVGPETRRPWERARGCGIVEKR